MSDRKPPPASAVGLNADVIVQQSFLCFVHMQGGEVRIRAADLDTIPLGKRMDMEVEGEGADAELVYRIHDYNDGSA